MPKRFLITYDSPVSIRSSFMTVLTPDAALVSIPALPVSPAQQPNGVFEPRPSVGQMLIAKFKQHNFEYQKRLMAFLTANPEIVDGVKYLYNNKAIPGSTHMKFFEMENAYAQRNFCDSRILQQTTKFSFEDAVSLLFLQGKSTCGVVNAVFGVDIACPLHKNVELYSKHQKMSCAAKDGFRVQNFASPESLISPNKMNQVNDLVPGSQYDALNFRLTFLQQQINENLLTEEIGRFYSLSELQQCNVNIEDLIEPQFKQQVMKLLKPGRRGTSSSVRITDTQLIQSQEITGKLKKENLVITSVVTQERPDDNVISGPCGVDEFLEYDFKDDNDMYTVNVTVNLQQVKMVVDKPKKQKIEKDSFSNLQTSNISRQDSDFATVSVSQSTQIVDKEQKKLKSSQLLQFINYDYPKLHMYLKHNFGKHLQDSGIVAKDGNLESFQVFMGLFLKGSKYEFQEQIVKAYEHLVDKIPAVFEQDQTINNLLTNALAAIHQSLDEVQNINQFLSQKEVLGYQSAIASVFKYNTLASSLFSHQFSLKQFLESIIQLRTGIHETIYHRLAVSQLFFYEKPNGHSQSLFYSVWAFDTQAAAKFLLNQNSQESTVHDMFFQFNNNEHAQHSLTKNLLTQKPGQQSELEYIKHENQEAVYDTFDKISSIYLYEPKIISNSTLFSLTQTDLLNNPQSMCIKKEVSKDLEEMKIDYETRLAELEQKLLDGSGNQQEIERELDELINSDYRSFTQSPEFYFPQDTIVNKVELENGDTQYSVENPKLKSTDLHGNTVILNQTPAQDNYESDFTMPTSSEYINIYHVLMLEPLNQEEFSYAFEQLFVSVPKSILQSLLEGSKKQPKSIFDLIQVAGADKLQELGFDVDYTTLFGDLSKYIKQLQPAVVFDQQIGHYYMPAVLEKTEQTLTSQFKADTIRQAHLLQQQLIDIITLPTGITHATLLSLLNYQLINRKFVQALKDYIASNFSAFMFMGMVVSQHIAQCSFEILLRFLMNGSDANTIHLSNIPDEEHYRSLQDSIREAKNQPENQSLQIYPKSLVESNVFSILDFVLDNEAELGLALFEKETYSVQYELFSQLNDSMLNLLPQTRMTDPNGQIDKYMTTQPIVDQLAAGSGQDSLVEVSIKDIIFNYSMFKNSVNFITGLTVSPYNNLLIGKNRGLILTQLVLKEFISPDSELLQTQKFCDFVSVKSAYAIYLTLQKSYYDFEPLHRNVKFRFYVDQDNSKQLFDQYEAYLSDNKYQFEMLTDSLFVPFWLHSMVNSQKSLQELFKAKIFAPIFQKYTYLEKIGTNPIIDVFGRELRHSIDFQPVFKNLILNEPAPLEKEAPPQPQASGEESAVQAIIDYWLNIHNKYFCIQQDRISAITSPLFVLEEREIELLKLHNSGLANIVNTENQQTGNQLAACKCAEFNAIMYPNQSGLQLEQYQRGILYMSPYFVPASVEGAEINRTKDFVETSRQAVTQISQLIRDGLNKYCRLPIAYGQFRSLNEQILESVKLYFVQSVPVNGLFEHLKEIVGEETWNANRSALARKYSENQLAKMYDQEQQYVVSQVPGIDFSQIHNCGLLGLIKHNVQLIPQGQLTQMEIQKTIDQWVENTQTQVRKQLEEQPQFIESEFGRLVLQRCMDDIVPLIRKVIQVHPLLDVLKYGDPADQSVSVPTDVCTFLKSGKLGKAFDEEKKLFQQLLSKKPVTNEVLLELRKNQEELMVLERENLRRNVEIQQRLAHEQYYDTHNEVTELYNTVVASAWAKAIGGIKANNGQKISNDILALAGFDTVGFPVFGETIQQLNELAVKNAIYESDEWDHEGFDIRDIVDFD